MDRFVGLTLEKFEARYRNNFNAFVADFLAAGVLKISQHVRNLHPDFGKCR